MPEISELGGLWRRSLIVHPDRTEDRSAWVAWLQGPSLFADLRIPPDRPSFEGVLGRRDLTLAQVRWLSTQEGFAGRLTREGEAFVWRRELDFQPPSLAVDAGYLRFDGDMMIEDGRDVAYIEHWRREHGPSAPFGAARLRGLKDHCAGHILRAGSTFMYARSRIGAALPPGLPLARAVENAPSLAAAQDIIDCEISYGRVGPGGWAIIRSSLPYREGACLDPEVKDPKTGTCRTLDLDAHGQPAMREWALVELEGALFADDAPSEDSGE